MNGGISRAESDSVGATSAQLSAIRALPVRPMKSLDLRRHDQ
jgi:hypothetical protein